MAVSEDIAEIVTCPWTRERLQELVTALEELSEENQAILKKHLVAFAQLERKLSPDAFWFQVCRDSADFRETEGAIDEVCNIVDPVIDLMRTSREVCTWIQRTMQ
ncbi:MAG TPA: hypothetical protein VGE59_05090 [Patescibacteria group bacterium]